MGSAHVLMKALKHVSTEKSLPVLACNLRRVKNNPGIAGTMEALQLVTA